MTRPPEPFMPKLLGLPALQRDPLGFLERCRIRHGDVFVLGFGTGLARTAWVCDPGLAAQIMAAPPEQLEAASANSIIEPIVGDGSLLLLGGADHKQRRPLLEHEFNSDHRRRDAEIVREISHARLARLAPGDVLDLWQWAREVTMQIMLEVVFGLEPSPRADALAAALAEFVDAAENPAMAFPALRRCSCAVSPWGRFLRRRAKAYALIEKEIRERRADPLVTGPDRPRGAERTDILSDLVRPGAGGRELSTRMIRDELVTLMIAGKETAAGGVAWALELLLRAPAELRLVREGLGERPSKRLRAAVSEALRLRVPLFAIGRGAVRGYQLGRFTIPEGMAVAVPLPLVYQSPELFAEPTLYRPDRWLQPDPPPGWVPFGDGVRRCIGADFAPALIAIVLRAVLERFELELLDTDAAQIQLHAGAFVVPKRHVRVRVGAQQEPAAIA